MLNSLLVTLSPLLLQQPLHGAFCVLQNGQLASDDLRGYGSKFESLLLFPCQALLKLLCLSSRRSERVLSRTNFKDFREGQSGPWGLERLEGRQGEDITGVEEVGSSM